MAVVESSWKTVTPSARWRNLRDKTVCSSVGIGLIAAFQAVARNALRPPWTSFDATHSTRNPIDGTWGPITQAALYNLASAKGLPAATLNAIKLNGQAKKIDLESARALVWLCYYTTRPVDLDVSGQRNTTPQPAVLGPLDFAQLELPAGSVLPDWNVRPSLPANLDALGAALPTCIPEDGNTFVLGNEGNVPVIKTGGGGTTTTTTTSSSSSSTGKVIAGAAALAAVAVLARRRKKGRR